MKVNSEYTQTNPIYLGGSPPKMKIPQDILTKWYLVNEPINFEIDKNALNLPPNIATDANFRWNWDEENNKYDSEIKFKHSYKKPGSYLLTIDVKDSSTNQLQTQ